MAQPGSEDDLSETWRHRALADAPSAFRAVVRATIEGAEGASEDRGNQCAATIFGCLAGGDTESALAIVAEVVRVANHDEWFAASIGSPSHGYIGAYLEAFADRLLGLAMDFSQRKGTVGEYLEAGSPAEELKWRAAFSAVGAALTAPDRPVRSLPSHEQETSEPRFVVYQYCISVGILSFKRSSGVKMIPPGGSGFLPGIPYSLISLLLGWWGIPWGPIWTLQTLFRNLGGGIDVTPAIEAAGFQRPIAA